LPKATKLEVETFLAQCRKIAPNSLEIINSEKNAATRRKLGLNKQIIRDTLLSLSVEGYSDGPSRDRTRKGEVWIFGVTIDNYEIYIKIKISKYNDPGNEIPTLVCLSFHIADFPQKYPHKSK
jgi:hypothetical protein